VDHILVIDDKPEFLATQIQHVFPDGVLVHRAATCEAGLTAVGEYDPAVVLIELSSTLADGLDTFRRVQELDPARPVVVVTDHPRAKNAIECIRSGAFDYLPKPVQLSHLREVLGRALALSRQTRLLTPPRPPAHEPVGEDELIGRSPAMQEVFKTIGLVAGQNVSVLILGDTGTGKELIAQAIRQHSRRADKPYLAINCAAIPETLLESELFGHERGAFTGADRRRIGKFEQCDGGTLFLDEVGDMSLSTQAKILRLIQQQEFVRVGGSQTIRTDVRLIAATNRDLHDSVERHQFRLDLYYRLNTVTIRLPPLRERGDDVQLLADQFVRRANAEFGRAVMDISPPARRLLADYPWPGNVRELQGVIREGVLRCGGPVLSPDYLAEGVKTPPPAAQPAATKGDELDLSGLGNALRDFVLGRLEAGTGDILSAASGAFERELYWIVWTAVGQNQARASRALGISRNHFRKKMLEFNFVSLPQRPRPSEMNSG
jgi:two-component system, NtrC family, response regulator AtoC